MLLKKSRVRVQGLGVGKWGYAREALIVELIFEQRFEGNAEASHVKIQWTYFAISQNMNEYGNFKITKEEIQVKVMIV